jgi:hypothetical protein
VRPGALLPLDGVPGLADLERQSVGRSHESYRYREAQWALGLDAAAQVSAYRPDRADGAPVFWSDALELARTRTVLWPYKPSTPSAPSRPCSPSRGAPLAEPDRFLDRSVCAEVVEFMIELAEAVPAWCADANPIDVAEALVGAGGRGDDYSVGVALFGYTNYSRAGFRPHLLAYDDLPSFDGRSAGSTLGGAGIAVSASTPHPQLAVAVAAELAGAAVQSGPVHRGRRPARQPARLAERDDERGDLRLLPQHAAHPRARLGAAAGGGLARPAARALAPGAGRRHRAPRRRPPARRDRAAAGDPPDREPPDREHARADDLLRGLRAGLDPAEPRPHRDRGRHRAARRADRATSSRTTWMSSSPSRCPVASAWRTAR